MADPNYPLPRFHFRVTFDSTVINCSEVTGLNSELDVIDYRDGASVEFSTQKMSGLRKAGDIVIKKGVFQSDQEYWDWYNSVEMNTPMRKTVTIELLDETHSPVMTWALTNAWPKKVENPDLKSDASEVAVETITIVHEGLSLA
jgi:phage tail-like protein